MKRNFCVMALAGTLAMNVPSVLAADGTINFTGVIKEEGCEIDDEDRVLDINLGEFSVKDFHSESGIKSPPTEIIIPLKNCPINELQNPHFTIYLTGDADPANKDFLKVTSGGATGVAIVIADKDKQVIPMNQFTQKSYELANTTMDLKLYAWYQSTSTTIGAGAANGTTDITFDYR
ncbi:fimbrial protein [Cronobacter turicensis]|uniref:fimbrial protein n=1 Tax=Cronobacter turicensis TaxID=413502 RepID=UPI001DF5E750|nr:fimbrial protein [Cronobacter turicensis]EGT5682429.1 type 1 fimbrial protein [Cronobacter turicensis]EGT5739074.1 type 1 fimbrial protein [Cronobacter turicensis]EKM5064290.1 type 1 fimbrial protein [Cronobacter turicensis]ELQ6022391.1 type 1 fimbrial protein [Cronobacter turicensis]ELQ6077070.1 type 1 fimbrial protein [Cronobacter turicensis]